MYLKIAYPVNFIGTQVLPLKGFRKSKRFTRRVNLFDFLLGAWGSPKSRRLFGAEGTDGMRE